MSSAVLERYLRLCLSLFFFSSRRRHTRCSRDWSSDVCSSDLSGTIPQIFPGGPGFVLPAADLDTPYSDRKSTRLNSSHGYISYAVFCLKKKNIPPVYSGSRGRSLPPPRRAAKGVSDVAVGSPR